VSLKQGNASDATIVHGLRLVLVMPKHAACVSGLPGRTRRVGNWGLRWLLIMFDEAK